MYINGAAMVEASMIREGKCMIQPSSIVLWD